MSDGAKDERMPVDEGGLSHSGPDGPGSLRERTQRQVRQDIVEFRKAANQQDAASLAAELEARQIELRMREEKVRQSEEEYKRLFENAREAILLVDLEGNITRVNRLVMDYGFTREELIGRRLFDFVVGDHRARAMADFEVLRGGEPVEGEMDVVTPKGIVSVEYHDNPIRRAGRVVGVQAVLTDITKRRRAQEELQRARDFAEGIIETARAIVLVTDTQGRIVRVNRYMEEISGYTPAEVQGRDWFSTFLPERDRERTRTLFLNAIGGLQTRGNVNPIVTKDGREREIEWYDRTLKDSAGNVVGLLSVGQDVTERRGAEATLRESEERFRSLFENCLDGVLLTSPDGGILAANAAACQMFGRSEEEICRLGRSAVIDTTDPRFAPALEERARTGKFQGELTFLRKDGTRFPGEITSLIFRDKSGMSRTSMVIRDISELKQADRALRESEEKYRELFENAREVIVILDLDGIVTDVNPYVEEYGLHRADLIGRNHVDFVVEFYREKAARDWALLRQGIPQEGEYEVMTPRGQIAVHYLDSPIVRNGKVTGAQSVITDVTERRRAEEALRESESRYRLLADNASDMIWTADLSLRLTYCSPFVERLLGYTVDEMLSKKASEILTPASYELVRKVLAEEMAVERTGKGDPLRSRMVEVEEVRKDGTALWVEVRANFLRDARGKAVGIVGVTRDISERKKTERQLLDYQARLRDLAAELTLAEERQRRRIAVGVHDQIGQRLALTKLTLQSLAAASSGENVSKVLNEACEEIEKVIQESHSLTFELSNPVLYEVGFEGAVESWLMQQVQDRHGIECTFTADRHPLGLDEETSVTLFHVVRELLTNVIKHAKAKHVDVSIHRIAETVQITVQDDGIGLRPAPEGRAVSKSGGFGLFNVQEKLDYLGGSVRIESGRGKGTSVVIVAPLRDVRSTRERDRHYEDHDRG